MPTPMDLDPADGVTSPRGFGNAGIEDCASGVYPTHPAPLRAAALPFALADAAVVIVTGILAKYVYLDVYLGLPEALLPVVGLVAVTALTVFIFFEQLELYGEGVLSGPELAVGRIASGLLLAFLTVIGLLYLIKLSEDVSRGWIISWLATCLVGVMTSRWRLHRWVRHQSRFAQRTALFGAPALVSAAAEAMRSDGSLRGIVGNYVISPADPSPDRALKDLQTALGQSSYDRIVICLPEDDRPAIEAAIRALGSYSVELLLCSSHAEARPAIRGMRTFGSMRMDVIHLMPGAEQSQLLKAALDYSLAAVGLFLLAPFLALVALAIKLDSPGPVFFRQRRYGQNNKVFRIFKFRTMRVTEDGAVVRQAQRDDDRVTRVGWFLRRTSIDELPQLINVLLGDMSLVGPRPHALAHDDDFEKRLDLFAQRRRVRPGITGWAQVNGLRGETRTTEDIRQRMQFDLYYVEHWSIWLDIEILARTLLIAMKGAY